MPSNIISQLEVISRETGCLLDISTLIDLSICPTLDIITKKPNKVEVKDKYITVTPTTPQKSVHYRRGCSTDNCYQVPEKVCKKNTVIHDIQMLVLLGLLSKEDLEKYLHITGELPESEHIDEDKDGMTVDPLLGLDVGEDGSLADLDVGGKDGLVNLNLGKNKDGKPPLANLNLLGPDGLLRLDLNGKPLIDLKRRSDRLADVDVGGKKDADQATIDVDVLTHARRSDRLADVDVGGKKDTDQAAIDVDVLTHAKRADRLVDVDVGGKKDTDQATIDVDVATHKRRGLLDGLLGKDGLLDGLLGKDGLDLEDLLDLDVGGEADEDQAAIDLDILTTPKDKDGENGSDNGNGNGNNGGNGNGSNNGGNGNGSNNGGNGNGSGNGSGNGNGNGSGNGSNNGGNGNGNGSGNNNGGNGNGSGNGSGNGNGNGNGSGSNNGHGTPSYGPGSQYSKKDLSSHYQPICNKGFKKEYITRTKQEHANDVNHCFAICQAQGALQTIHSGTKRGDVAHILVCAAIQFDQAAESGNCHYMIAPETEPCEEEYLEEKKDCYTFVRN